MTDVEDADGFPVDLTFLGFSSTRSGGDYDVYVGRYDSGVVYVLSNANSIHKDLGGNYSPYLFSRKVVTVEPTEGATLVVNESFVLKVRLWSDGGVWSGASPKLVFQGINTYEYTDLRDDGTGGDVTPGDGIYSKSVTLPEEPGYYMVFASAISDDEGASHEIKSSVINIYIREEVECSTDEDCDDGNVCTDDICINGECIFNNNTEPCNDDIFCNGDDACSGGSCSIHEGDPCYDPTPKCDEDNDLCVECLVDSDCDDVLFCNGDETCVNGTCQSGTNPCPDDGFYCTGMEGCDEVNKVCTQSGNPCPGADGDSDCSESCNEAADNCTGNDPNGSSCSDDFYCTVTDTCQGGICTGSGDPCPPPLICNEEDDACNCSQDEDCKDELFCNGVESCGVDEKCQPGNDPCPGQSCSENKGCFNPPPPPPPPPPPECDDGLYCNGVEIFIDGMCKPGDNPCRKDETCDEENDVCEECFNDTDCNDGLFCTGAESCVDGDCQPGTNPCPDDGFYCTGVEGCDEDIDECISSGNPCPPPGEPEKIICEEENDICVPPGPVVIDVTINPNSSFCSHLIPLPLIMFIEGEESNFNQTTTVSFEGDAIWPPMHIVLSPTTIFVFSIIKPAGLEASGSMEVLVGVTSTVDNGVDEPYDEEGSTPLTLNMLPWILEE